MSWHKEIPCNPFVFTLAHSLPVSHYLKIFCFVNKQHTDNMTWDTQKCCDSFLKKGTLPVNYKALPHRGHWAKSRAARNSTNENSCCCRLGARWVLSLERHSEKQKNSCKDTPLRYNTNSGTNRTRLTLNIAMLKSPWLFPHRIVDYSKCGG